jgi:hypothetical protein
MFDEETHQIRNQQKFLQDVEHAIRDINRTVIHAKIPHLNRETFVALASLVARLRADYLHAALHMANGGGTDALDDLARRRVAFEEARAAFAALERAIERGYVDIG